MLIKAFYIKHIETTLKIISSKYFLWFRIKKINLIAHNEPFVNFDTLERDLSDLNEIILSLWSRPTTTSSNEDPHQTNFSIRPRSPSNEGTHNRHLFRIEGLLVWGLFCSLGFKRLINAPIRRPKSVRLNVMSFITVPIF